MDADQIRRLRPELTRYLKQFDDCFARRGSRVHLSTYVEGQFSDLSEKRCEPMALAAGVPPTGWRAMRDMAENRHFCGNWTLAGKSLSLSVPTTLTGWINEPQVSERPFRRAKGRRRKTPRLVAGSPPAIAVQNMLKYSPALRDQAWVRYHVKEGQKGPLVWEVKQTRITVKDENDLPGTRLHLAVARNVLDPEEIKCFVSNAPPETSVQTWLRVAFSRWRVQRCFQDQKQEVGLDPWEGRRWLGLKRGT